jgi:hypothetical protein
VLLRHHIRYGAGFLTLEALTYEPQFSLFVGIVAIMMD